MEGPKPRRDNSRCLPVVLMNPQIPSLVKDATYELPSLNSNSNANDGQLKFIDQKEEATHRSDLFFEVNDQRLMESVFNTNPVHPEVQKRTSNQLFLPKVHIKRWEMHLRRS